uniref:Uncharacterized protein n=1 Tax=Callorhinchus milii TaxID=7868 RepID=A0A4W3GGM8_CALMI
MLVSDHRAAYDYCEHYSPDCETPIPEAVQSQDPNQGDYEDLEGNYYYEYPYYENFPDDYKDGPTERTLEPEYGEVTGSLTEDEEEGTVTTAVGEEEAVLEGTANTEVEEKKTEETGNVEGERSVVHVTNSADNYEPEELTDDYYHYNYNYNYNDTYGYGEENPTDGDNSLDNDLSVTHEATSNHSKVEVEKKQDHGSGWNNTFTEEVVTDENLDDQYEVYYDYDDEDTDSVIGNGSPATTDAEYARVGIASRLWVRRLRRGVL